MDDASVWFGPVSADQLDAVHELARRGGGTAAVALCGGGGRSEALLLSA